jgi:hypothetical protein
LDYSAPTTYDNSSAGYHLPPYFVNITEYDNIDSDPTTYYCNDTANTCNPTTPIDNGGMVAFTTSNRGVNYFRYYSVDFAGNIQANVSKEIDINRVPFLNSSSDNATLIKGGSYVNITTVSSDLDAGQSITLFVCNSTNRNSSGCIDGSYCNVTGLADLTCAFASENDSTSHTWY